MYERSERPAPGQCTDDRPVQRQTPAPPAALLQLQRGAGNQATARALAGQRTIGRWRDFGLARGTPQSDYKIVDGSHATAGKYHIKFHNHKNIGVFDEIHVVFEDAQPKMAYFFYDDAGKFLPGKSTTGLDHPDLAPVARELVDAQLATSEPVAKELVEKQLAEIEAQGLKDQVVKDKNLAAVEEKYKGYEVKEAEAREASKVSADEAAHIENFAKDIKQWGGEIDRLRAYIGGVANAAAAYYWKDAADWYKTKRAAGWPVKFPSQRLLKDKVPTVDGIRKLHALPDSAKITFNKTKSGPKHFNVEVLIAFSNYTTYAASTLGEKPPPVQ